MQKPNLKAKINNFFYYLIESLSVFSFRKYRDIKSFRVNELYKSIKI
jgi:hypothetical protein